MFERFLRRRKANAAKPTSDVVPWDAHLVISQTANHPVGKSNKQGENFVKPIYSPSIKSLTPPATPLTPDIFPMATPNEKTFRTNGEYYDQFLIQNGSRHARLAPLPDQNGSSTRPRPLKLKNMKTLRGMPLPKRTPITLDTSGVDPRSPLPTKEPSLHTTISSQVVGMMAPRPKPAQKKKELNKPKSLNLKSSTFRTLSKAINQISPSSSSTIPWAPRPSPATSIASRSSTNTKKTGRSPLVSAPEFGLKWRSEYFKDLIPQLIGPQTSVPWRGSNSSKRAHRQAAAASRYRDRKKRLFTSGLGSMPDNHLPAITPASGRMHISPPIMSNMLVEDPIPSAFLTAGSTGTSVASPRSAYFQSLPSASSVGSNRSRASSTGSKLTLVKSTELVVKRDPSLDIPVSSGKTLLFN